MCGSKIEYYNTGSVESVYVAKPLDLFTDYLNEMLVYLMLFMRQPHT